MAVGFPTKANWAAGDVLTAAQMDDLAGTVNLINPSAKGDIFTGSTANTYVKTSVGTNGQVLTADSTASGGVKWSNLSSWTKVASGSFPSATSITFSSLSGNNFYIYAEGWSSTSSAVLGVRINGSSGANYVPSSGDVGAVATYLTVSGTIAAASTAYNGIYFPASLGTQGHMVISGSNGGVYNDSSGSAITSITLLVSAGNFDAGIYEVWSN